MLDHILQKRGPKRWPPGFFPGQCTDGRPCFCDPPPPERRQYYYYTQPRRTLPCCVKTNVGTPIPMELYASFSCPTAPCIDGRTFKLVSDGNTCPITFGQCHWSNRDSLVYSGWPSTFTGGFCLSAHCDNQSMWSQVDPTLCGNSTSQIAVAFGRVGSGPPPDNDTSFQIYFEVKRANVTGGCVRLQAFVTSCAPFVWSASGLIFAQQACNSCGNAGGDSVTVTVTE